MSHPAKKIGRKAGLAISSAISQSLARPFSCLIFVIGVLAAASGFVMALLSVHDLTVSMTWGMVSVFGLGMPILSVLYQMDTRRASAPNEQTAGSLSRHSTRIG